MGMQKNVGPFILAQKRKQSLMKVILLMYLHQSMLQLYQTYKYFLEKVHAKLLIQSSITLLISQSTTP